MATANEDRRRQILHQHEITAAHVAAVGLQQQGLGIGSHLAHRSIAEQPPVAAIRVVPDRVGALRQAIVRIVRRQIAAFGPCDAKYDSRIGLLDRILDRRQDRVGECDVIGEVLFGIGAGISR
jgi:hypothetical protein